MRNEKKNMQSFCCNDYFLFLSEPVWPTTSRGRKFFCGETITQKNSRSLTFCGSDENVARLCRERLEFTPHLTSSSLTEQGKGETETVLPLVFCIFLVSIRKKPSCTALLICSTVFRIRIRTDWIRI